MANIRAARNEDIPQIESIIETGYRGEEAKNGWTYESDLIDGKRLQAQEIANDFANPKNQFFVYESDESQDEIYGVICIVNHGEFSEFGKFSVLPSKQSLGIGKKLIQFVENYSKENWGLSKIKLCVLSIRTELVEYYKRRGYIDTGIREDFIKLHPYVVLKNNDYKLEIIVMEKAL